MKNSTKELSGIADTAADAISSGAADMNGALGAAVNLATDFAKSAAVVSAIPGVSAPSLVSRTMSIFKRHPKILVLSLLIAAGVAWKRSSGDPS